MHEENIIASNTFEERRLDLPVTEPLYADLAQAGAKVAGDAVCQIMGIGAGEDLDGGSDAFHVVLNVARRYRMDGYASRELTHMGGA